MKTGFKIFMAAVFCLFMAACSSKGYEVKQGAFEGVPINNDIVILKNTSDVSNYLAEERFSGSDNFKNQLGEYTDEYFQNKDIIVINIRESSSSNTLKVSSVEKTESAITVTIKRKTPDRGTDALKTWSFIVELEKSDAGEVRYTII